MVMMLRDDVVVEGKIIFKIILVQNFKLVIYLFFSYPSNKKCNDHNACGVNGKSQEMSV